MRSKYVLPGVVSAVLLLLAFAITSSSGNNQGRIVVDLYHSPTCGCCELYEEYLEKNGFEVRSKEIWNIENIKRTLNIPQELWSCHTVKIGKYYVEGHVPVEVIKKLLEEQPEIEGIALPGMPSGSPGMPAEKTEEFVIFAVSNSKAKEFMRV